MYWSFWGMNALWWIFWVILAVTFLVVLTPVPRSRLREYEDPMATLRRRYARGEITTAEYEERRHVLMRTEDDGEVPPAAPTTPGVPRHAGPAPSRP